MITKEEFEKLAGIKLTEKEGKLYYDGNLILRKRQDITELPDNFNILGGLDLSYSGVKRLPKGLNANLYLNISGTSIEKLPEDTKFGGNFYANDMENLFRFQRW